MNNETLRMIEEQIGYSFKNHDLLRQAFVRRSYTKENGGENNEILEFIGDKVLDFVVVKRLTETFGTYANEYEDYIFNEDYNEFICEHNEGKLTNIKKKLVCKEMLANRIRIFGFQYLLIMGNGDDTQNIWKNDSVQEDLFEAIIGAIALDSNWNIDKLENSVNLMLDIDYYIENGFDNDTNYVELIQQWCQKKHNKIPVYVFREKQPFFCDIRENVNVDFCCELGLYPFGKGFSGYGKTKSEARMNTAKMAYEFLEDNNLLFTLVDEVGEPDIDRAINQLQELYQKGYIGEPCYDFVESYDNNGNPIWKCECYINGMNNCCYGEFSSKKQGKKVVAYDMLCDILEWGDENYEA